MDPLDIALLFDSPDENWPSMDLVGEMLLAEWRSPRFEGVSATPVSVRIPSIVRRLPWAGSRRAALNADRALARYVGYPVRALAARRPGRLFHVVDHSYAQLVHVLPAARTGVYCHDLDAFAAVLPPHGAGRSIAARGLARTLLEGVRSAAVVFHSTREVGRSLAAHRIVEPARLVHAPYGVAAEFTAAPDPSDGTDGVLSSLEGRAFLLHVGSEIPRKRLDVVFDVFARLKGRFPALRLVQQGARLSAAQKAQVAALGIAGDLLQPPKLERRTLAGLYRRAAAVLVTSEAEGFGFPVVEALACGAIVVATDIPVLREVGGDAALYAPLGDVPTWTAVVACVLEGAGIIPPLSVRRHRASVFRWETHARTLVDAYRELVPRVR